MTKSNKPLWNEIDNGRVFCLFCAEVYDREQLRTRLFAMTYFGDERALVCQDCFNKVYNLCGDELTEKFMSISLGLSIAVHERESDV